MGGRLRRAVGMLVVLAIGCDTPTSPTGKEISPALPAFEPITIPGDESPTPDEAQKLGFPPHDRVWTAEDMIKASRLLAEIAKNNPKQLPRYRSERSGKLFARITTPQNLEPFRNPDVVLEKRLGELGPFVQSGTAIMLQYFPVFLKKIVNDSEVLELLAFQLRGNALFFAILLEYKPTIKPTDPNYEIRLAGFEQAKVGLAHVVNGTLRTVEERQHYRDSELVRLLGVMQETIPGIVPHLKPEARNAIRQKLERMESDPVLKEFQPQLVELRKRVDAAMNAP